MKPVPALSAAMAAICLFAAAWNGWMGWTRYSESTTESAVEATITQSAIRVEWSGKAPVVMAAYRFALPDGRELDWSGRGWRPVYPEEILEYAADFAVGQKRLIRLADDAIRLNRVDQNDALRGAASRLFYAFTLLLLAAGLAGLALPLRPRWAWALIWFAPAFLMLSAAATAVRDSQLTLSKLQPITLKLLESTASFDPKNWPPEIELDPPAAEAFRTTNYRLYQYSQASRSFHLGAGGGWHGVLDSLLEGQPLPQQNMSLWLHRNSRWELARNASPGDAWLDGLPFFLVGLIPLLGSIAALFSREKPTRA